MKKIYSILTFGILLLILGFTQQIAAQQTLVHPGIPFVQAGLNQLKATLSESPGCGLTTHLKNDSRINKLITV